MPYSCVAPGCPIPNIRYDVRLKRPPGCRFTGRCSVVAQLDDTRVVPEKTADPGSIAAGQREQMNNFNVADETPAVLRFIKQPAPATELAAVLVVDGQRIAVSFPCVLGRRGSVGASAFSDDRTVSREHAELRADANGVVVRNIAKSGNTLTIDGRVLELGESVVIRTGTHEFLFGAQRSVALEIR